MYSMQLGLCMDISQQGINGCRQPQCSLVLAFSPADVQLRTHIALSHKRLTSVIPNPVGKAQAWYLIGIN